MKVYPAGTMPVKNSQSSNKSNTNIKLQQDFFSKNLTDKVAFGDKIILRYKNHGVKFIIKKIKDIKTGKFNFVKTAKKGEKIIKLPASCSDNEMILLLNKA